MKYRLEVSMDDAAMADAPCSEIARILREAATRADRGEIAYGPIMDINGNSIGGAQVIKDE